MHVKGEHNCREIIKEIEVEYVLKIGRKGKHNCREIIEEIEEDYVPKVW